MSLWNTLFPPPPDEIREAVVRHQVEALRGNLPVLHAVAVLNLFLVAFALWADGFSAYTYAWMVFPAAVSIVRAAHWMGRAQRAGPAPSISEDERQLRLVQTLLVAVMFSTSSFSVWATATRFFSSSVLVPISLIFGSLCLAHAMASLPRASITAVLLGIVPSAFAMGWLGDGLSRLLSISALTVSALQVAFLRRSYAALLELLMLQKRMSDMASFDSLTGLLSRRAVLDEIAARVEKQQPFALAMVDLDGFKAVNDTRGHAMGDALLRAVSKRFLACGDVVGRLGGDEFVVLVDDVSDDAACVPRMEQILAGAREPVIVGGATLQVSASIGHSLFPRDAKEAGALMRVADEAMYDAKKSGKARIARPLTAT